MTLTAKLFSVVLSVLAKRGAGEGKLRAVLSTVVRFPVKAVAAFFAAPFLAFHVARFAKNPIRRAFAGFGLFFALICAWFAGTILGTLTAALFIASKVGLLAAIGILLGTTLSVFLSVSFQIIVFNLTSLLFLKMSTQEVADHLASLAQ